MSDANVNSIPPHLSMGRVALTVNDLNGVADYYQKIVGLHLLGRDGESTRLGAGGQVLLELRRDKAARRRSRQEAGLFHTAFLLPERSDLAAWVNHAIAIKAPVIGASDHAVSEALYLTDPEGNGIEIYIDRPSSAWTRHGSMIEMTTDPLDVENLLASVGDRVWRGFPDGSSIGHVHLQVGDIPAAEAFYAGVLGLDVTARYPGGVFYGADGYHHHIATNTWSSRGAGVRSFPSTGLAEVAFTIDSRREQNIRDRAKVSDVAGHFVLNDPWGTPLAFATR